MILPGDKMLHEWIKCNESLPTKIAEVGLTWNGTTIEYETYYSEDGSWYRPYYVCGEWTHDVKADDITHWIPQPKPPKE